jgi:hypothetical protein
VGWKWGSHLALLDGRPSRLPLPLPRRGKTNFFERRVGEYQRAGVMQSVGLQRKHDHIFNLNEDF